MREWRRDERHKENAERKQDEEDVNRKIKRMNKKRAAWRRKEEHAN